MTDMEALAMQKKDKKYNIKCQETIPKVGTDLRRDTSLKLITSFA